MNELTVVNHPLCSQKLGILRDKTTPSEIFRRTSLELSTILLVEATKLLKLSTKKIETPLAITEEKVLESGQIVFVPILRAGLGMIEAALSLIPSADVGHIGLYREHESLESVKYYSRLPSNLKSKSIFLLDPMLATGGSACHALNLLKEAGAKDLNFICFLAAPEGVKRLETEHPDVKIITAALDERLNEIGYIVPGLGDAGDRVFGTE